eukprot:CAMPEP_0197918326 /NCGR_PEP_ID=MMETSP1439-20131203/85264_1 /TAXON_ID=66791 /ORGANISM="Gonyaulax spinifera, Strain CCMP409" /LENGTH=51 /DNA_ID=CAMNT_0043540439 /DNA_START=27 /DNA_END=179 /DNA_ORIENTATION=-
MKTAVPMAENESTVPRSSSDSSRPPRDLVDIAQRGTTSKNAKHTQPCSARR